MNTERTNLFVGHWRDLLRGRDVPRHSDFTMRDLQPILASTFVVDASNIYDIRYQRTGSKLSEYFGRDLTNERLLLSWSLEWQSTIAGLLKSSLGAKRPLIVTSAVSTAKGTKAFFQTSFAPVGLNDAIAHFYGFIQPMDQFETDDFIVNQRLSASDLMAVEKIPAAANSLTARSAGKLAERALRNPDGSDVPSFSIRTAAGLDRQKPLLLRRHPRAPHLGLVINTDAPLNG